MLPLLQDVRRRAHQVVPAPALDYLETGSGQEVTLDEAERAWRDWRLVPEPLAGAGPLAAISTATQVLGDRVATPVLAAPTAYHRFVHDEGELATARGVAAAGSLMVVSSRVTVPLEDVADVLRASGTPWWWQSYLVGERAVTAGLAERAAAAGASAVVLTGDTPYVGNRARAAASSIPLDEELLSVNMARHLPRGADPATALAQAPARPEDIRWLHGLTGLPVLVKGVLSGPDALRRADAKLVEMCGGDADWAHRVSGLLSQNVGNTLLVEAAGSRRLSWRGQTALSWAQSADPELSGARALVDLTGGAGVLVGPYAYQEGPVGLSGAAGELLAAKQTALGLLTEIRIAGLRYRDVLTPPEPAPGADRVLERIAADIRRTRVLANVGRRDEAARLLTETAGVLSGPVRDSSGATCQRPNVRPTSSSTAASAGARSGVVPCRWATERTRARTTSASPVASSSSCARASK